MSIVIRTQYLENYGADDSTNHWKFKWGNKFIVEGTDERPANAVALVTNYLSKYNKNIAYAIEYVHSWALETYDEARSEEPSIEDLTIVLYYEYYLKDTLRDIVAPI